MFGKLFSWLKKIVLILWLLFMAAMGASLAMDNSQMLSLKIFKISLPETSLGLIVCVSVLIGLIFGLVSNYLMLKPGLIANKRALSKAQKEVNNLRTQSLRE